MIEKVFETNISANTLKARAYRIQKDGANVPKPETPCNPSENPDNQVVEPKHGGKRKGAGAPPKYKPKEKPALRMVSDAMHKTGEF